MLRAENKYQTVWCTCSCSFAYSTHYFLDTLVAIAVSFPTFSISIWGGGDVNILFLYIPTPPWLFEQAEQHDLSRCPRIKNTSVVVLPGLVQSPRSDVDIVVRLQNIHLQKWIETKNIKNTSKVLSNRAIGSSYRVGLRYKKLAWLRGLKGAWPTFHELC